jgi:hypothetical protein
LGGDGYCGYPCANGAGWTVAFCEQAQESPDHSTWQNDGACAQGGAGGGGGGAEH